MAETKKSIAIDFTLGCKVKRVCDTTGFNDGFWIGETGTVVCNTDINMLGLELVDVKFDSMDGPVCLYPNELEKI